MKLELRVKGIRLTQKLREHVEERVSSAMGRFSEHVRSVHVYLKDINGPKGGEDIECQIQAVLAHHGALVIRETKDDPFAAVARASQRASHNLARQIDKLHTRRRGR